MLLDGSKKKLSDPVKGLDTHNGAGLLFYRGEAQYLQGNLKEADSDLKAAFKTQRTIYKETPHPFLTETLSCLGKVYFLNKDYSQAKSYFMQAFKIQSAYSFVKFNTILAEIRRELCKFLRMNNKFVVAEQELAYVLTIQRKAYRNDNHPEIAITLNEMAELENAKNNPDQAINYQKQAHAVLAYNELTQHPLFK